MKILQINVFHYPLGGSETVYFNTTNILKENGNDVIHFALKWKKNISSEQSGYFPESKETRKGLFKSVKNIVSYFYNYEAAKKIEKLIVDTKPDLAQIHLFWGQITPAVLPILKKYHIPIVFTIHEYRMVCPNYTFRNGYGEVCEMCKGKFFYNCIKNKCCRGSRWLSLMMAAEQYFRNIFFNPTKYIDGLIYVSTFAKNIHEKYMPNLANIPNVVLYNLSDEIKEKANVISSDNRYYLYFGRLSYEKGVKTLIEAFMKMPQCKLKIAGIGSEEYNLKNLCEKCHCSNIEFLGFKSGESLKELIKNAYFIIVPSEWYENNPMTIIEGYSVSTPVIGASIGGIPEIIKDKETGLLFESGNVGDLISKLEIVEKIDNNEYNQYRINALEFAKNHFNRNNYYPQLISFYNQVLN